MLSAYAKETSRLCGNGYLLLVAQTRSLMQMIPVHSCIGGCDDEDVGPAWLNETSGCLLTLLRSLTTMMQVHYHGAGEGGGWVVHA